jgi:hypothetical protein
MTIEAAASKLAYLLGKNLPLDRVKTLMMEDLRGELSPNVQDMPLFNRGIHFSKL